MPGYGRFHPADPVSAAGGVIDDTGFGNLNEEV